MIYESVTEVASQAASGVVFTVVRMSFARRLELMRKVREFARRVEFHEAGQEPAEKMDAALLQAEIDRLYLEWGLQSISGLEVDGMPATPEVLASRGPEELFREALAAVRAESGLSAAERKN
jgi:hypothetical protein